MYSSIPSRHEALNVDKCSALILSSLTLDNPARLCYSLGHGSKELVKSSQVQALTSRLDCDTVEPEPKLSLRPIGWKALMVDKGFRL